MNDNINLQQQKQDCNPFEKEDETLHAQQDVLNVQEKNEKSVGFNNDEEKSISKKRPERSYSSMGLKITNYMASKKQKVFHDKKDGIYSNDYKGNNETIKRVENNDNKNNFTKGMEMLLPCQRKRMFSSDKVGDIILVVNDQKEDSGRIYHCSLDD